MMIFRMFFISAMFSFLGCTRSEFLQFQEIKGGWDLEHPIKFSFPTPESKNNHHVFLYIHNDHNYPFSNLFVITELTFPNQTKQIDTLQFEMATKEGASLGKGWLDVKEHKLWIYENIDLKQEGTYTFRVRQAMRTINSVAGIEKLAGILDVGLGIESVD